jgi:hypothetical protein
MAGKHMGPVAVACLLLLAGPALGGAGGGESITGPASSPGPAIETPALRAAVSRVVRAQRSSGPLRGEIVELALEVRALRALLLDLVHAIARGEGGSQASLVEASGARIEALLGALREGAGAAPAPALDLGALEDRAARLREEIAGIVGAADDAERSSRALALFTALDSHGGRRPHRLERPPIPTFRSLPARGYLGEGP